MRILRIRDEGYKEMRERPRDTGRMMKIGRVEARRRKMKDRNIKNELNS